MACCARFTARADIRVVDVVDNVTTLSICASFSSRFALGVAGNAAVMDGRARFERDRHQNDGIACLLCCCWLPLPRRGVVCWSRLIFFIR